MVGGHQTVLKICSIRELRTTSLDLLPIFSVPLAGRSSFLWGRMWERVQKEYFITVQKQGPQHTTQAPFLVLMSPTVACPRTPPQGPNYTAGSPEYASSHVCRFGLARALLNHLPWQDSADVRAGVRLLRTVPSLSHPSTPSNCACVLSMPFPTRQPPRYVCLLTGPGLTTPIFTNSSLLGSNSSHNYPGLSVHAQELSQGLPANLMLASAGTFHRPLGSQSNTTLIANGLHCKPAAAAKAPKKQAGDDPMSISHACKTDRHPALLCLDQVALAYRPELSFLG